MAIPLLSLRVSRCAAALEDGSLLRVLSFVLHSQASIKPAEPCAFPLTSPPHQPRPASETTAASRPPPLALLRHDSRAASSPQRPSSPRQPLAASETMAGSRPPPPGLLRHDPSSSRGASSPQRPSSPRQPLAASETTAGSRPPSPALLQQPRGSSLPHQPSDRTWAASKMAGCRLPPSMRQIWCRHPLSRPTSSSSSPPWTLLTPSTAAGARGYSTESAASPTDEYILPIVLHPKTRFLSSKIKVVIAACTDTSNLHLNFDPKDYVDNFPILKDVLVPDFNPPEYIFMATDKGLVLIRSLPEFLRNLHESGYCISPLTPLSLDNLAESSDGKFRVRLDLVKFVPLGGSEGGSIAADYNNAGSVLSELLVHGHGKDVMSKIRRDLRSFFNLLKNCSVNDGYFICHHGALVPLNNKSDVFMKLYYFIKRNLETSVADNIIDMLPLCFNNGISCFKYATHWWNIAFDATSLNPWLNATTPAAAAATTPAAAATTTPAAAATATAAAAATTPAAAAAAAATTTPAAAAAAKAATTPGTRGRSRYALFNLHRNVYCHKELSVHDMNLVMYALYPTFLTSLLDGVRFVKPEVFRQLNFRLVVVVVVDPWRQATPNNPWRQACCCC